MRAIRLHGYGPPENLRLETMPDLQPASGEVRIAVAAAGVHLIDAELRAKGAAGALPAAPLPMTPGREVAGIVDAVGPDVERRWLGSRVVVHLGAASGGYASQAVAGAADLFVIPAGLGFDPAVAMVGTGRTAMGIVEVAAVTGDDVVLVTAAAGGVGSLLVQHARSVGAFVIGTVGGAAKLAVVGELGVDLIADHNRADWPETVRSRLGSRGVSVVLDGIGGAIGTAAMNLLAPGGRLVMFGWASGGPIGMGPFDLLRLGISASAGIGTRVLARPGGVRPLQQAALDAAASGAWVPLINPAFLLADAAGAHRAMVARRTVGKTILRP